MSASRRSSVIPEMRRTTGRGPLDNELAWLSCGGGGSMTNIELAACPPQTTAAASRCSSTSFLVALLLSNTTGCTAPILESIFICGGVDVSAAVFCFLLIFRCGICF